MLHSNLAGSGRHRTAQCVLGLLGVMGSEDVGTCCRSRPALLPALCGRSGGVPSASSPEDSDDESLSSSLSSSDETSSARTSSASAKAQHNNILKAAQAHGWHTMHSLLPHLDTVCQEMPHRPSPCVF